MDNKMLREVPYFPSPGLLASMEVCFMNPQEKLRVVNAIGQQLQQLRPMLREWKQRSAVETVVLEYFTERLCIPSSARPLFLSRLELVEIYQPTFNFVNEFFEANKSELVQGLVEEGMSTILQGRVPAVPPSLIAIESFLQEILIRPEEFLQKVKSRPKNNRTQPSSFSFEQEYDMIKNLVVKYLDRVLKEGSASYYEALEVFQSKTSKTFREKMIAFLQAEELIAKMRLLHEFFRKIKKMDNTIPPRKTQAEERRRTALNGRTPDEELEYFAGFDYKNRRATPERAQPKPQSQKGRRDTYTVPKRQGEYTHIAQVSRPTTMNPAMNIHKNIVIARIGADISKVPPRPGRPPNKDPPDSLDEVTTQSIKSKQRKTETATALPRQQVPRQQAPVPKSYLGSQPKGSTGSYRKR